jgi:C-terminal novel E3 ligase, LRR-interacting
MSALSAKREKRLFKKSASQQYLYAKGLTPQQRTDLEEALAFTIRSGSDEEARQAMTMWLSVQQARLRTHSQPQRLQYEAEQYRNIAVPLTTIVGAPAALPLLYSTRNRYYASAERPEYATAFNNFMKMIDDPQVSEDLRNVAASRLAYHARREGTIASVERLLLRAGGPAGLAEEGYRVDTDENDIASHIGSESDDIDAQQRPLGAEINRFLYFARQPAMPDAGRFDDAVGARAFARVLARTLEDVVSTDTPDLHDHPTMRAGTDVLHAISQDIELRELVFAMSVNALGSCSDNVAEGFSSIVNAVQKHKVLTEIKAGRMGETELREWAGAQFRLSALETEVHRFIEHTLAECNRLLPEHRRALNEISPELGQLANQSVEPHRSDHERMALLARLADAQEDIREQLDSGMESGALSADEKQRMEAQLVLLRTHDDLARRWISLTYEPVETMLHAKASLYTKLRLPDSTPRSLQFHLTSAVTKQDLRKMAEAVRNQESDPEVMRAYRLGHETWRAGIRLIHHEAFDKLDEKFASDPLYDRPIPPAGEEHIEEQADYAAAFRELEARQQQAENALLQQYAQ